MDEEFYRSQRGQRTSCILPSLLYWHFVDWNLSYSELLWSWRNECNKKINVYLFQNKFVSEAIRQWLYQQSNIWHACMIWSMKRKEVVGLQQNFVSWLLLLFTSVFKQVSPLTSGLNMFHINAEMLNFSACLWEYLPLDLILNKIVSIMSWSLFGKNKLWPLWDNYGMMLITDETSPVGRTSKRAFTAQIKETSL